MPALPPARDDIAHRETRVCAGRFALATSTMENIYWPRGAAPPGEYEFWLLLPNPEGMTGEDTYTIEVRLRDQLIWSAKGMVVDLERRAPVHRVRYPEGEVRPVD